MDKLKKTGIVSVAALIFLLIASLAAYLFGFAKTDYPNAALLRLQGKSTRP